MSSKAGCSSAAPIRCSSPTPAGVHRLDSARAHRGSPPILVIMGVSGSGKSTIAEELSARLGWPFEEGDSLHPEANIAKMHAGIPLTDADRLPWLERVAAWIDGQRAKKQPGIITCSALKRAYRQIIIGDRPEVRFVYLRGGRDLIAEHLSGRHGHFMPSALLRSQIDTLEEPDPSEDPLTVDVGDSAAQVAEEIIRLLGNSVTIRNVWRRGTPKARKCIGATAHRSKQWCKYACDPTWWQADRLAYGAIGSAHCGRGAALDRRVMSEHGLYAEQE